MRGGGAETLVRELLPRLQSRGVRTAAFSAYDPDLTPDERRILSYEVFEGNKRAGVDLRFASRLIGAIRRFRPDIVHTHTVTGKYWGRAAAILSSVPAIIHTEHSPQPHLRGLERPFAAALAPHTTATVTFSKRTLEFVRAREPVRRAVIIPNGIQVAPPPTVRDRMAAKRALDAGDKIVVGVVASFQPQKNQRLAVEAFALLTQQQRLNAQLHFFGFGPEEEAVSARAARLGVTELRFWGFRPDVRRLLPGLDALLTVALVEAAPISLLEAMGAALPIIGTPHHGTLDLVENNVNGLICADWSPGAVAAALGRAIDDDGWRTSAGAASRSRLEADYNIEAVADRHVALYSSLLNRSFNSAC